MDAVVRRLHSASRQEPAAPRPLAHTLRQLAVLYDAERHAACDASNAPASASDTGEFDLRLIPKRDVAGKRWETAGKRRGNGAETAGKQQGNSGETAGKDAGKE